MTKKKKEKANVTKDVTPYSADDLMNKVLKGLSGDEKTDMVDKCISNYLLGDSYYNAGIKAGFSDSYSKSGIPKKIRDAIKNPDLPKIWNTRFKKITESMGKRYRDVTILKVPQMARIDAGALDEYEKDPSLAIKKPQLLKHLKQSVGIMDSDLPQRGVTTVQIQNMQVLMKEFQESPQQAIPGQFDAIEEIEVDDE